MHLWPMRGRKTSSPIKRSGSTRLLLQYPRETRYAKPLRKPNQRNNQARDSSSYHALLGTSSDKAATLDNVCGKHIIFLKIVRGDSPLILLPAE
jgi:hypothetical protein